MSLAGPEIATARSPAQTSTNMFHFPRTRQHTLKV